METHRIKIDYLMIVYSILLGALLGIASIQRAINNDPMMQAIIQDAVESFFIQELHANFSGSIGRISLFFPELTLNNVHVTPLQSDHGHWKARHLTLKFSWIQFFLRGYAALAVEMHEANFYSPVHEGTLMMAEHIEAIIAGQTPLPIRFHALQCDRACYLIADEDRALKAQGMLSLKLGVYGDRYRLKIQVLDGSLLKREQCIIEHMQIELGLDMQTESGSQEISLQGTCSSPLLPATDALCKISGHFKDTKGQFLLHNQAKSCVLMFHDIDYLKKSTRYDAIVPGTALKLYEPTLATALDKSSMHMTGSFEVSGPYPVITTELRAEFHDEKLPIECLSMHGTSEHGITHADITGIKEHKAIVSGAIHHECTNNLMALELSALEPLGYKGWLLASGSHLRYTNTGQSGEGSFMLSGSSPYADEIKISGEVKKDNQCCTIQGIAHEYAYTYSMHAGAIDFRMHNQKGASLVQGSLHANGRYSFAVEFDLVQHLMKRFGLSGAVGRGTFLGEGTYSSTGIECAYSLRSGALRLSQSHNLLRNFTGSLLLDLAHKKAILKETRAVFDKGALRIPQGQISFTDEYGIHALHVPCIVQSLLVNHGKEVSAVLAGALILSSSTESGMQVKGYMALERARCNTAALAGLKSPHASGAFTKMSKDPIHCDVLIETKHDMHMKMPFMHAALQGQFIVRGVLSHLEYAGTLRIHEGKFLFPYHPLTINRGTIHFIANKFDDPLIDFDARGKIRNYHIRMHCSGTAQEPHITFESSPPLTEEQILTLLFAGSQEGSLSMIMPAMAMHRLKNIVLGEGDQPSSTGHYLKKLLSPLRFIRFVPHFNDQTARGGLRGAIEVDVTDHMRAIIQKNFSISEDSKIEVEYYLSDEITLRAVKDERSDIGAEIEVRWKL